MEHKDFIQLFKDDEIEIDGTVYKRNDIGGITKALGVTPKINMMSKKIMSLQCPDEHCVNGIPCMQSIIEYTKGKVINIILNRKDMTNHAIENALQEFTERSKTNFGINLENIWIEPRKKISVSESLVIFVWT